MGVDIVTYRCRIGSFCSGRTCSRNSDVNVTTDLTNGLKTVGTVIFIGILLVMSGIEPNPGPRDKPTTDEESHVRDKSGDVLTKNEISTEHHAQAQPVGDNATKTPNIQERSTSDIGGRFVNLCEVVQQELPNDNSNEKWTRSLEYMDAFAEAVNDINSSSENVRVEQNPTGNSVSSQSPTEAANISLNDSHTEADVSENTNAKEPSIHRFKERMAQSVWMPECSDIISKLGIDAYFPQKLTLQEVIKIKPDKDKKDLKITDVPWLILQKLIEINYRARDNILADVYARDQKVSSSIDTFEIDSDSDLDDDTEESDISEISPLDCFIAIMSCCNNDLLQYLFNKLFICKLAIPFISMVPFRLQFHLWSLRSIELQWKTDGQNMFKEPAVSCPCKIVSFIRIKRPLFSKSKLINNLMCEQYHDTFFNCDCPMGKVERKISEGLVECSWYQPSGKTSNISNELLMFLNLRGDATIHKEQTDMIAHISNVVVILIDTETIASRDIIPVMRNIHRSNALVVLILTNEPKPCEKSSIVTYMKNCEANKKKTFLIKTLLKKNGNMEMLKSHTCKVLFDILSGQTDKKIEEIAAILKEKGCQCDEDMESYKEGKIRAEEIICYMSYADRNNKQIMITPLQIEHWGKIAKLTKQIQREGSTLDPVEIDSIQQEIIIQRKRQFGDISEVMVNFFRTLTSCYQARDTVIPFLQNMKFYFTEGFSRVNFGLDNLFRELGQIFESESFHDYDNSDGISKQEFIRLPDIVAELLLYGYPLEIMDGEVSCVPLIWVEAVFKSLKSLITDKRILAVSALGIESSGKSTLLNTMFGLQFPTSSGKSTRGISMQLIPIDETMNLPFQYIAVFDTQGLRTQSEVTTDFRIDNELATLVIGISDVTIINVKGENIGEIKDVLQIVVHTFLRLKRVNKLDLRQSCFFVHQNVPAIDAKVTLKQNREILVKTLNDMTVEAATEEQVTGIEEFSQIINFDSEKNVLYISDLWQGSPPMAASNTDYSCKVNEAKQCILNGIAIKQSYSHTVSDTLSHIKDVWNAVSTENFVFAFRNSLEIKAYRILEDKYKKFKRSLETHAVETIPNEIELLFSQCSNRNELDQVFQDSLRKIKTKLDAETEAAILDLSSFIQNHELSYQMEQWKPFKIEFLKTEFSVTLFERSKTEITELCHRWSLEHSLRSHELEINSKAKELAKALKGNVTSIDEMRVKFDSMWSEWLQEFGPFYISEKASICDRVTKTLHETFTEDTNELNVELQKNPLENKTQVNTLVHSLQLKEVSYEHLRVKGKRKFKRGLTEISFDRRCRREAIQFCNQLFAKIDGYLGELRSVTTKHYVHHLDPILDMISSSIKEHNDDKTSQFLFTIVFKIKLAVHVSKYAIPIFESLEVKYEQQHSIKARLEKYRETNWTYITQMVKQETEEVTAVLFFIKEIKQLIIDDITKKIPLRVENNVVEEFNDSKRNLINELLLNLAQNGNFDNYKAYITDPYTFSFRWITEHTNSKMFNIIDKETTTLYAQLAENESRSKIRFVNESIQHAMEYCAKSAKKNIKMWLQIFEKEARKKMPLPFDCFSHVENLTITDFDSFEKKISDEVDAMRIEISDYFKNIRDDNVDWNGKPPYGKIMQRLWGCNKDCPFCHEPCQMTDPEHIKSGIKHSCIKHRPRGVTGFKDDIKNDLGRETCNFFIQTEKRMFSCVSCSFACRLSGNCRSKDENTPIHQYRKYRYYIKDWDIAPSANTQQNCAYWIWFMYKFRRELEREYSAKLDISSNTPNIYANQVFKCQKEGCWCTPITANSFKRTSIFTGEFELTFPE